MTVEITFAMPPSANNLYANRAGGGMVLSREGKAWREIAGLQLNTQHPKHVAGPVTLDIAIQDIGNADLDGKSKAAIDLLVGYGIITDYNRRIVRRITLYWDEDVQGCRVRVNPMRAGAPTIDDVQCCGSENDFRNAARK